MLLSLSNPSYVCCVLLQPCSRHGSSWGGLEQCDTCCVQGRGYGHGEIFILVPSSLSL